MFRVRSRGDRSLKNANELAHTLPPTEGNFHRLLTSNEGVKWWSHCVTNSCFLSCGEDCRCTKAKAMVGSGLTSINFQMNGEVSDKVIRRSLVSRIQKAISMQRVSAENPKMLTQSWQLTSLSGPKQVKKHQHMGDT